jgi:hypothetical protein
MCAGSTWSLRHLQAELLTVPVRQHLEQWSAAGEVSSLLDWQILSNNLGHARKLHANLEDNQRLSGLLQEWRGHQIAGHTNSAEEILTARRAAVDSYRQALRLRPSLPNTWAHLARMKLLAGEADDEFRHAVGRTLALGAHVEEVQLELIYISAIAWEALARDPVLAGDLRSVIRGSLARGQNAAHKLQLLQSGGQLAPLCSELSIDSADMPALLQRSCAQ